MTEFEKVNQQHEELHKLITQAEEAGIDVLKVFEDAVKAIKQEGAK